MWVSWLYYDGDGNFGGGSFWQGKDGREFGPGYQIEDRITTVHHDVVATPSFAEAGRMTDLDAAIGPDSYSLTFETTR